MRFWRRRSPEPNAARRIRDESERRAIDLGYGVNPNLPLLDPVQELRSTEAVIDRRLCLTAGVACAYGCPKPDVRRWVGLHGLTSALSPFEQEFLASDADADATTAQLQWQVESIWALVWSLQLTTELDFGDHCSDGLVNMVPDPRQETPIDSFKARCDLRDAAEVIQAADLAYCLHWATRQAAIEGEPAPGSVVPAVITERRRALEWLIGDDDWDEVPLDT